VQVKGKMGEVAVDQIRTLSKQRLYKKIGSISADDALKIRLLISEMYGNG
jgi:mRNA interferase MazF